MKLLTDYLHSSYQKRLARHRLLHPKAGRKTTDKTPMTGHPSMLRVVHRSSLFSKSPGLT